ncbi:MAG: YkgJ family cysteine cluster protein [Thiohalospira sp.]
MFRRWWRRRRRSSADANLTIEGECNQCGACCAQVLLVSGDRPVKSHRAFRRLVRRHPDYAMFRPVDRNGRGELRFTCDNLGADGRCTIHDRRPPLCRDYPSVAMARAGGELPAECSYRVVPLRDFRSLLEAARSSDRRSRPGSG